MSEALRTNVGLRQDTFQTSRRKFVALPMSCANKKLKAIDAAGSSPDCPSFAMFQLRKDPDARALRASVLGVKLNSKHHKAGRQMILSPEGVKACVWQHRTKRRTTRGSRAVVQTSCISSGEGANGRSVQRSIRTSENINLRRRSRQENCARRGVRLSLGHNR